MDYWRGYSKAKSHYVNEINDEVHRAESINSSAFEDEPNDKELGVQLNHISKVYNKLKNKYLIIRCCLFIDLFIFI